MYIVSRVKNHVSFNNEGQKEKLERPVKSSTLYLGNHLTFRQKRERMVWVLLKLRLESSFVIPIIDGPQIPSNTRVSPVHKSP